MSAHANPDIVTDGLAFIYDTGSGKSYKGEPTINTAGTTGIANSWNNSGTAAWSNDDTNVSRLFTNLPVFSMEKLTSGSSHIGTGSTSATVSTEYTYSVYVWIPSSNSVNMAGSSPYFRPQPANASVGSLTYEGSSAWGTWPRDQWVRVSITATTQATNVTSAYISCYLNTAGDKIYFTAPQFEQKGHATPFVNGTRSATQGLLDLTNNTTINLSNVSFDSNAQMVFDGTDDYTSLGNPTALRDLTSGTIETVYYRDASSGTYQMVFTDGVSDLEITYSGNTLQFYIGNSGLSYTHAVIDQWFNVVGTWGSGFKKLYINGAEVASGTNTGTDTGNRDRYVGGRGANFPFNGEIPIAKIYNKALTASEVLQNYNATKGRFQ